MHLDVGGIVCGNAGISVWSDRGSGCIRVVTVGDGAGRKKGVVEDEEDTPVARVSGAYGRRQAGLGQVLVNS